MKTEKIRFSSSMFALLPLSAIAGPSFHWALSVWRFWGALVSYLLDRFGTWLSFQPAALPSGAAALAPPRSPISFSPTTSPTALEAIHFAYAYDRPRNVLRLPTGNSANHCRPGQCETLTKSPQAHPLNVRPLPKPNSADDFSAAVLDQRGDSSYVPVPKELIGTREYYLFRAANAPKSFKDGKGANYYLEYGLKFFDRFQALKKGTQNQTSIIRRGREVSLLNPDGSLIHQPVIDFIDKAAVELQVMIERGLAANPSIGENRSDLLDFAFGTHDVAYRNAGFGELGISHRAAVGASAIDGILQAPLLSGEEFWDAKDMWLKTEFNLAIEQLTGGN